MKNSLLEELGNFNLSECKTIIFDDDVYAYLTDKHSKMNSRLNIKEAESWESATKLVLTD